MSPFTSVRVVDGPYKGKYSLFLGNGLSADESTFIRVYRSTEPSPYDPADLVTLAALYAVGPAASLAEIQEDAKSWTALVHERVPAKWYQFLRYAFVGSYQLKASYKNGKLSLDPDFKKSPNRILRCIS